MIAIIRKCNIQYSNQLLLLRRLIGNLHVRELILSDGADGVGVYTTEMTLAGCYLLSRFRGCNGIALRMRAATIIKDNR